MTEQLRLGLLGVTDGRELAAALQAEAVTVVGFAGENRVALADIAAYYGVDQVADWRELLAADALLVGTGVGNPQATLNALAAAGKPLLLSSDVLGRADAIDWLTYLGDASLTTGIALSVAVDDGLAYCRDLVRGGLLGQILGVEVHVTSEAVGDEAWTSLGEALAAAMWVTDLELHSLAVLQSVTAGAIYVSALIEAADGVPLNLSFRAGVPGGAHSDVQGPRILGERGQLILASEPLGWFTQASEGNRAQQWERVIHAGQRGSLARGIQAFALACRAHEPLPLSLSRGTELARILAALRGIESADDWLADEQDDA